MCSLIPVSPSHSIDYHAEDTRMFMHLESLMEGGGPLPVNVHMGVNPYSFPPEHLPSKMLYFFNSEDSKSFGRDKGVEPLDAGYWQPSRTSERCHIMGTITSSDFYRGQAPHGDKTNWVMHEYRMDRKLLNLQGTSSLCRVFNHGEQIHLEENKEAGIDEEGDDFIKAALMSMLDAEENNHMLDSTSNSHVVHRKEHECLMVPENDLPSRRTIISVQDPNGACDFIGDFFELDDLNGSASSSSSSENTLIASITSDDYFDSEALLQELEAPTVSDTKQKNVSCQFNVSASRGLHQVVLRPPPSGRISCNGRNSNNNNNSNTPGMERAASSETIVVGIPARSVVGEPQNWNAKNGPTVCGANELNRGPSTSKGAVHADGWKKRKAVGGRIAELNKKYCCFLPF